MRWKVFTKQRLPAEHRQPQLDPAPAVINRSLQLKQRLKNKLSAFWNVFHGELWKASLELSRSWAWGDAVKFCSTHCLVGFKIILSFSPLNLPLFCFSFPVPLGSALVIFQGRGCAFVCEEQGEFMAPYSLYLWIISNWIFPIAQRWLIAQRHCS